jgi:sugar O-acyltransferase (sialic acid O-acetyltransferase NeuD family)
MINLQERTKIAIVGYNQATITQEFYWWIGQEFTNVEIIEPANLIPNDDTAYIISVTKDKHERQTLIDTLSNNALATFIHSSAIIHGNANINQGVFIGPNVSIYFNVEIDKHSIVAPYSMVSHNTKIGTNTILHPGVMIAGSCNIGSHCLFGMRSTIIDKIDICNNVFIGAGSLVTKNIIDSGNYTGSPARKSA